jgi:hypothetical protein
MADSQKSWNITCWCNLTHISIVHKQSLSHLINSQICQGGTVPKEYYNQAEPHHAMVTGNIGRGSTLQLEYEVHEPNSVIRFNK